MRSLITLGLCILAVIAVKAQDKIEDEEESKINSKIVEGEVCLKRTVLGDAYKEWPEWKGENKIGQRKFIKATQWSKR